MKKRLLKPLLLISITFFFVFGLQISLKNSHKNEIKKTNNKSYKIIDKNSNFIQTIAYYLLQPLIESRIDHYIKIYGLEDYLKTLNNRLEENFQIQEINSGNGEKALCGNEISVILYKINDLQLPSLFNENNFQKYNNSIINFKIGNHEIKELNYALEGLKEGGERVIIIKNNNNDINQLKNYTSYYVKLLKIKNNSLPNIDNLLIFDNIIENTNNSNSLIKCGDEVSIKYTLRDHTGIIIIKDQVLKFTVGEHKVPTAIEFGTLNMNKKSTRSVIVPTLLLSDLNTDINYNKNSIKIINISVVNNDS